MHGDFSRLNAPPEEFSRVLFQQGRVQLDSDANELTELLLRASRQGFADIIGPHGGVNDSFAIAIQADKVLLRWGYYYVDGIRCANFPKAGDRFDFYLNPSGNRELPFPAPDEPTLLYLDVFEAHISPSEADEIREIALLGPDTTSRALVVWRVRALETDSFEAEVAKFNALWPGIDAPYFVLNRLLRSGAMMRARAMMTESTDPCTIAPDAQYRGVENRLYRVEVHRGGDLNSGSEKDRPTFKWSPDNGSIVYPIDKITDDVVHLHSLGRDDRTAIRVNDWVEVVDGPAIDDGAVHDLLQVVEVRLNDMSVKLNAKPSDQLGSLRVLRRWAAPARPARSGRWLELSDGVEVEFKQDDTPPHAKFRTGDYWLIPARTEKADVIWNKGEHGAVFERPFGVQHHYAPLALVGRGMAAGIKHYRRMINLISAPV